MTKQALFVLAITSAAALTGCGDAPDIGNTSQRSIDADISATHDEGPTLSNQNIDRIAIEPTITVPFHGAN